MGFVNVIVNKASGSAVLPLGFDYIDAPVVVAAYNLLDTSDGGLLLIAGTDLINATSVTVGGVEVISHAYMPATGAILAHVGAAAAGSKDVVVTTPLGVSTGGTGIAVYWDPSLLTLSVFAERGSFSLGDGLAIGAAPSAWVSRASAGASGARVFNQDTTAVESPTEVCKEPVFDGTSQRLDSVSFTALDAWSTTDGTIVVGFRASVAAAAAANTYEDPGLVGAIGGGGVGLGFSDGGLSIAYYNGAVWNEFRLPASKNVKHIATFKWSGGDGKGRVGVSSFTAYPTIGTATQGALPVALGAGFGGSFFSGDENFVICAQSEISDGDCNTIAEWAAARHGTSRGTGTNQPELWYVDSDVIDLNVPKRVTVKGRYFEVGGAFAVYFGTLPATDAWVLDDNTIVCTPPVQTGAGVYPVAVFTTYGFTTLSNAVEYYDALARSCQAIWRVGNVASRTVAAGLVTALTNTSGVDGVARNLTGAGWGGASLSPKLYAADLDFGGEDSLGADEGTNEVRNMTSGAYGTPIAQPATVYFVFKRVPNAGTNAYLPINASGSATNAFSFVGLAGSSVTWQIGGSTAMASEPLDEEREYGACFVFNGDGTARAQFNEYFLGTNGAVGTDTETAIGIGTHPGEASRYKWAMRMVVAGVDSRTVRRRMQRWMANRYQIGRTLRTMGPQLLLAAGSYAGTSPGTWTERRSHNAMGLGGDGPPNDAGGIPNFAAGSVDKALSNVAFTQAKWSGAGNSHQFCVFDPITIVSTNVGSYVYNNESPFDGDTGYLGFYLRLTGGIYYCDYYQWDTDARVATISLGADISVSNLYVMQGKKEDGFVWIRRGLEAWIKGAACGSIPDLTGHFMVGSKSVGEASFHGRVSTVASWKRALSGAESDRLAELGLLL